MSVGRCFLNGVKNTEVVDKTTYIAENNVVEVIQQFQNKFGTNRTNPIGV